MIYKQPTTLSGLKLKNRFFMAPVKTGYGSIQGDVNDRHIIYYDNISKSGASLVIIEPISVSQSGKEHPKQLTIHLDNSEENLKKIVDTIHSNNCYACININHAGRAANPKATGMVPKSPSIFKCASTGILPEELSINEIKDIINDYSDALTKACHAGFDAIEVQCGHGYLINQFLSTKTNFRKDQYGEDKTLFVKEVFNVVKKKRKDLTVFIRISGSEFVEGGLSDEDNELTLSLADDYGFDAVHCGFGNVCDSPAWYYSHMALPEKKQLDALSKIKNMTNLPVIAAGRMADIKKIKYIEENNLADFISFGRPLVADHNLINKIMSSKYEEIIQCGYCLQGCLSNVKNGTGLGCIVNPEIDKKIIYKTSPKKKVAVIGSGPAGMSTAITLSKRGHDVTLFESDNKLGGQFALAYIAPYKQSMQRPLEGITNLTKRYVSKIKYNYTFTEKDIKTFDIFIIASGSKQSIPEIKNLESQNWMTSLQFFRGEKKVKGRRILIIGAGMVGMEAAEQLIEKGYQVIITKRTDTIANDMELITKKLMLKRLSENKNIKIMPETTVIKFTEKGTIYQHKGIENIWTPFDTVIIATGMISENSIYDVLKSKNKETYLIGDADKPSDIYTATQNGYNVALTL